MIGALIWLVMVLAFGCSQHFLFACLLAVAIISSQILRSRTYIGARFVKKEKKPKTRKARSNIQKRNVNRQLSEMVESATEYRKNGF